ncbi:ElaD/SseL family deubiquitinase [uncultured Cedecea sp.]|uniref:ElaD/SseL family deubiquitinase n=1 Tax=uncultured Cedecea sp. TaxID=988762 RepID=UPI0026150856|nr:ElaD/SseL family deubiquitinase [uncultured Cedecea sp.]
MNINTISNDYYNTAEFNTLFSEKISKETLDSLKISASKGSLRSIELLNNLALRQDESGRLAEKYLFDMFCGTTPTDEQADVVKNIQRSAQMLYRLSNDKMKNNADMHKLRTPSKLLYMAGAAADIGERLSLSRVFTQSHSAQSEHEQTDDTDIWNSARMISSDEINAALKSYTRLYDTLTINYPVPLIHPESHENMLSYQLGELCGQHSFLEHPEFFPINTGEHWITFGLYKSDDGKPRAIICNTWEPLSLQTKQQFSDAAYLAGITDSDAILFLEQNIQEYVPNGCGLLTIEAIRRLMENNFQSPDKMLENFLTSFTQQPIADQERFNLENRYRIYAETYLQ